MGRYSLSVTNHASQITDIHTLKSLGKALAASTLGIGCPSSLKIFCWFCDNRVSRGGLTRFYSAMWYTAHSQGRL